MSENNTVEGFIEYSTGTSSLSSRAVSDLETIINGIQMSSEYQSMNSFYDDLQLHLSDFKAHDFDISLFSNEIVSDLYSSYRSTMGYGTKYQMLSSVVWDIEIGTLEEDSGGTSICRGTNVPLWTYFMNGHESEQAHTYIFSQIKPSTVPDVAPNITFSHYFPEDYHDEYPVVYWNAEAGSITCSFQYDFTDSVYDNVNIPLFDCSDGENILSARCKHSSDGKTILYVEYTTSESIRSLFSNELPIPLSGYDKFIIYFTADKMTIRDMTSTKETTNPLLEEVSTITLVQPLTVGSGISEWNHYNTVLNSDEQNFFLV